MSTPVATVDDLATYLGIASIDNNRAVLVLQLAHDRCESYVSPVPDSARGVEVDIAARAYINPSNAQQETTGPFSVSHGAVSGGLWLTRANIADLRRLAGSGGAFTIDPTPADAGPGNYWGQLPLTPGDIVSSPPYYGDWDYPPTA